MSITYNLLSELEFETVENTVEAIGIEIEFIQPKLDTSQPRYYLIGDIEHVDFNPKEPDDPLPSFYVIGNDEYGYCQMWVKDGFVTNFTQYGISMKEKSILKVLFHCFNLIYYDVDDCGRLHEEGFNEDLEELPAEQFFEKYYLNESEIYQNSKDIETLLYLSYHELYDYIESQNRTLNSYRIECGYVNGTDFTEIYSLDTVTSYIQSVIDSEQEVKTVSTNRS